MKNLSLFLLTFLAATLSLPAAYAAKIQQQGIVSTSDCASRGISNSSCLPTADQIYDGVNGQQLSSTLKTLQSPAQAISASAINWALGNMFTKTLLANTTFTFSGQVSGQTIVVRLTNTASNWTVTWPSVKWTSGTAPTMTPGATSDVYTFIYDGSSIYGNVVQDLH